MSPKNEVKLSQSFKVILEIKKSLSDGQKVGFDNKNFFISGFTKEKVILEQDVWASQIEFIEKITCFLKVNEKWKEHKISNFCKGKKASDSNGKKKDRKVKSFSFQFSNAKHRSLFEKDLSELNP